MWWLKNKPFVLLLFIFLLSFAAHAQRYIDPELSPSLKDRMYFGGNFALSFGTITYVDISPLAGVMLTERFSTGIGATYQYFNDTRFPGGNNNLYGGRLFARYNVFPNIFLHSEYENLNFDLYNLRTERFERSWIPSYFVGAGYFTPFGDRGGANFMLLYNLQYDARRSPYNEPYVIRVGFVF